MLNKLVEYIKNNHPDTNVDAYLDAKYIQLNNTQLKQIADALESGELATSPASSCGANHFIFHFGSTIILLQKDTTESNAVYTAELAWETDFLSVRSVRDKAKGFYFINFEFDDDYQTTLLDTQKIIEGHVNNSEKNQQIVDKVMPVLKGFMNAISD
ncbi:hypothetical protein SP60_07185 [Candidatus Thioglobus autotrophicus]|jgi:hypothetical protein|uniref:Uncharacterized protein n=1 Tax=Candidatus Thioglobus autotrophicus TaxID=1705394 RepID=A0A0M4NUI3_9GAMM|nr:hypothetical protein [Candidatus Thioglobus autotrophicus]ALE52994.1 hypothetical protein SP60_07185 [Candidatus Thioglobus autotrophicus]WPE17065.1 hypothetical protein R5P06_03120 [Candidatus Thioglobus autotrophicus]WPE18620.1 hypothetical protein R5P05_03170 [Candidatus Thioglobus autotrophicus]